MISRCTFTIVSLQTISSFLSVLRAYRSVDLISTKLHSPRAERAEAHTRNINLLCNTYHTKSTGSSHFSSTLRVRRQKTVLRSLTASITMARPKLTLFLDVVSPFGYMAFYMTRVRTFDGSCCFRYLISPWLVLDGVSCTKELHVRDRSEIQCICVGATTVLRLDHDIASYSSDNSLQNSPVFKQCDITYVKTLPFAELSGEN
jgi:hypothetical protein